MINHQSQQNGAALGIMPNDLAHLIGDGLNPLGFLVHARFPDRLGYGIEVMFGVFELEVLQFQHIQVIAQSFL